MVSGKFPVSPVGLNPLGALKIEQKGGRIDEVYSGDVVTWE